jgi:hypothetical protein
MPIRASETFRAPCVRRSRIDAPSFSSNSFADLAVRMGLFVIFCDMQVLFRKPHFDDTLMGTGTYWN